MVEYGLKVYRATVDDRAAGKGNHVLILSALIVNAPALRQLKVR